MGHTKKWREKHIKNPEFKGGMGSDFLLGARQKELTSRELKFLRMAGLREHDVAHVAQAAKPRLKDHPHHLQDFAP